MSVKRWNGTSWDTYSGGPIPASQVVTWKKTAAGGETSLSGSDDNLTNLSYTVGQEQVFINGVLQVRGADYVASTGNSITGLTALIAGDIVQVWCPSVFQVPSASATASQWRYIATGGETTLTGVDSVSVTLAYTVGQEMVFQNGNLLYRGTDYTATNGTSITLTNALIASDVINVWSPNAFTVANAIPVSTVTYKGDLLAATGSGTVTNLAVGADGTTLVADSSTSTGLRYTAGTVQSNPVLNSAFQVWQRGTSFANAGASIYTADRWQSYANAAVTVSRQATGDTTNLPNIQYCARNQRNSGSTSTAAIAYQQSFESVNSIPFAGKTITFSFYARAGANYSATSSALNYYLVTGTGTDQNIGGAYTGAAYPINTTATLTTTWQRFTATATLSSSLTEFAYYFSQTPVGTAGANDYYEVTGVQIDIGSVALPFRTYAGTLQGELAACQRYYWRFTGPGSYSPFGMSFYASTTAAYVDIVHPVTMRIAPNSIDFSTLAIQDVATGLTIRTVTALVIDQPGFKNTSLSATIASGGTPSLAGRFICNGSTTAYLGLSAEL